MKIVANLTQIQTQIHALEQQYQRPSGAVQLLAVSKTRSIDEIRQVIESGQRDFGENYCQEAVEKIQTINDPKLIWHFIGPVQSNKTSQIASHFHWVHTVDRIKIAKRLHDARPETMSPINICIQINISGEASKSGILLDQAEDFIKELSGFSRLKVRGLMALPAPETDLERQRQPFAQLRQRFEELAPGLDGFDTLSIGTTQDMEAAIAEGATIVRIGTAIFGPRDV